MTHLPVRSKRGPASTEWFSMDPGIMVLIWAPLSKRSHASLPIDSYPGHVFDPVQSVKGVRIQEGSLCLVFYALGVPSWDTFSRVMPLFEGLGLPSLVPSPLFSLNGNLF